MYQPHLHLNFFQLQYTAVHNSSVKKYILDLDDTDSDLRIYALYLSIYHLHIYHTVFQKVPKM